MNKKLNAKDFILIGVLTALMCTNRLLTEAEFRLP